MMLQSSRCRFARVLLVGVGALGFAACGTATFGSGAEPGPGSADAPDARTGQAIPPIDAAGDPASRFDASPLPAQAARLRVVNRCTAPIWIAHSNNLGADQNVALADGAFHDYDIPAAGLASVRFWPKTGCDASGHGCKTGDNGEGGGAPCGPGGCTPPFDSKFEITFSATGAADPTYYNLSLVDGYTLPFAVRPVGAGAGAGSCVASDCGALTLDACPSNDNLSGGGAFPAFAAVDLRVKDPADASRTIACMAPCKEWNYPAPYGLGKSEALDPGLHLCCPTPIDPASGNCTAGNGCIGPDACRAASDPLSVVHTSYVGLIHARCPSAYSYSYDDAQGLHACPSTTGFEVTFCP
jgi:Thaumatin family